MLVHLQQCVIPREQGRRVVYFVLVVARVRVNVKTCMYVVLDRTLVNMTEHISHPSRGSVFSITVTKQYFRKLVCKYWIWTQLSATITVEVSIVSSNREQHKAQCSLVAAA